MSRFAITPRIHRFESTADAYTATQTDDSIRDGDVLVIESEKVAGFLCAAWPIAVTEEHGEFHTLAADADITCLGRRAEHRTEYTVDGEACVYIIEADAGRDYTISAEIARREIG